MKTPEKKCPFCAIERDQIILERPLALAKHDGYALTKGHTLIIPRRHVASFFDCTAEERQAMLELLTTRKRSWTRRMRRTATTSASTMAQPQGRP